jgi:hypothetical protein
VIRTGPAWAGFCGAPDAARGGSGLLFEQAHDATSAAAINAAAINDGGICLNNLT